MQASDLEKSAGARSVSVIPGWLAGSRHQGPPAEALTSRWVVLPPPSTGPALPVSVSVPSGWRSRLDRPGLQRNGDRDLARCQHPECGLRRRLVQAVAHDQSGDQRRQYRAWHQGISELG